MAPGTPSNGAPNDAAELRDAADTLRRLVPSFRGGPVSEFVPVAVAKLLDAVATSLVAGDAVSDTLRSSALEIARHLRTYPHQRPG
jgi:hypothetical protein